LIEELEISFMISSFCANIPMDKFDYRYAEGKWNIKEIIQHVIDTERILVIEPCEFPETIKPLWVLMRITM
jgi:hypothetical protein